MDISMKTMRKSHALRAWMACAAAAVVLAPTAALAAEGDVAMAKNGGLGAGSAFASLVYAPVKVAYAVGGLLVGGLSFAFSGGDVEVARTVLTPSVLGDYVITTEHLRGERPVEFFGRRVEAAAADEPEWAAPAADVPAWDTREPTDMAAAPEGW